MTSRVPARRGGPPVGLTRDAILRAADTFDVDDLSMPRVAATLGVSHAALYHWFPNKQALIRALVESTLREVELPSGEGLAWQEEVLACACAVRDVLLLRSSYLPHVTASASAAASPIAERVLAVLDGAGFAPEEAVQVTELVFAWSFYSAWQSAYFETHDVRGASAMGAHLDDIGVAPDARLRDLVARYAALSTEEIFRQNLAELLRRFAPG